MKKKKKSTVWVQSCTQQKLLVLLASYWQFSQHSPRSSYGCVKLTHRTLQQIPRHLTSLWNCFYPTSCWSLGDSLLEKSYQTTRLHFFLHACSWPISTEWCWLGEHRRSLWASWSYCCQKVKNKNKKNKTPKKKKKKQNKPKKSKENHTEFHNSFLLMVVMSFSYYWKKKKAPIKTEKPQASSAFPQKLLLR